MNSSSFLNGDKINSHNQSNYENLDQGYKEQKADFSPQQRRLILINELESYLRALRLSQGPHLPSWYDGV